MGAALLAAMVLLFLVANRGAYKGFFQDDDLDNLSWTRDAAPEEFLRGLLTPQLSEYNFRPIGHYFYRVMGRAAGFEFPRYIAVLHGIHFVNVWLVWLISRRLKATAFASLAAALFFAFHMAAFDAYWRPMYIFDVLCAFFLLAAILAYLHGRIVVSFAAFWLAYKSKEFAIMLPAVLLAYEFWLGERRWKRLLPFFAVSAVFGLQAIFANRGHETDYTLRLTPAAFWTCLRFYASELLLVPYAGLLPMLALPFMVRDHRVRFGIAALWLLLLPMLFLPGRLFSVYLYGPLIGLCFAFAALAGRLHPAAVASFFVLWLPFNYSVMRDKRRGALAVADENRAYFHGAAQALAGTPDARLVVFDGAPAAMHRWGVEATIRLVTGNPRVSILSLDEAMASGALGEDSIPLISWDGARKSVAAAMRRPGDRDASFIRMTTNSPVWQLKEGWFPLESGFRWTRETATAVLGRPDGPSIFEATVNVGPEQIEALGAAELEVLLDGRSLGTARFHAPGWQTARWPVPAGLGESVTVEFRARPAFQPPNDPRTLGVAIAAFGFTNPTDQVRE